MFVIFNPLRDLTAVLGSVGFTFGWFIIFFRKLLAEISPEPITLEGLPYSPTDIHLNTAAVMFAKRWFIFNSVPG
jgi:hypothetical protein